MTPADTDLWPVQASSATSDTWVTMSGPEGVTLHVDAILAGVRDGNPRALDDIELRVTNRGRFTGDMLWAQGGMYVPISSRVVDTLTSIDATGWTSVPVTIRHADGEELPGYHLLVVTGECGDFFAKSEAEGRDVGVDPSYEWDGSDVFWIRGRPPQFNFCVTDRVRRAFEAEGLSRIEFEDPAEF